MLKKFLSSVILVFLALKSFVLLADSQVYTIVDEKCRADYLTQCIIDVRKNLSFDNCPEGAGFERRTPDNDCSFFCEKTCSVTNEFIANQTIINICESREHRDLPQNCYRNIDLTKLDQIHTSLTGDMRLLLAQFCKTYEKDATKCDGVLKTIEKK